MKRKYSIEERRSKILNMLHTDGRVAVDQLVCIVIRMAR